MQEYKYDAEKTDLLVGLKATIGFKNSKTVTSKPVIVLNSYLD